METTWEKLVVVLVVLGISGAVFHKRIFDYLRAEGYLTTPVKQLEVPLVHTAPAPQLQAVEFASDGRAGKQRCITDGQSYYIGKDESCAKFAGVDQKAGYSVSTVDSIKSHDNYVRDPQGRIVGKVEIDMHGKPTGRWTPEEKPSGPSVVSLKTQTREEFEYCSSLNVRRLRAVQDGAQELAAYYDREFKRLKCMRT